MTDFSYCQSDFRGGQWSNFMQGRIDDKRYRTALAVCQNYYFGEEGSLTRRPALALVRPTKYALAARAIPVTFGALENYMIEAGSGYFRFFSADFTPVLTADSWQPIGSINYSGIITITTTNNLPADWATGDTIVFQFVANADIKNALALTNQEFLITVTGAKTFTLQSVLDGSNITGAGSFSAGNVGKIFEVNAPYLGGELTDGETVFSKIRKVQALNEDQETGTFYDVATFLHPLYQPQSLTQDGNVFALTPQAFKDGPYLDPPTFPTGTAATTLTPDATTGTINLTASALVGINDGQGFLGSDINRHIRLMWGPPPWDSSTTYAGGDAPDQVTYNGNIYICLKSNTDKEPDINPTYWQISQQGPVWNWCVINGAGSAYYAVIPAWDAGHTYSTGDIVWYVGVAWTARRSAPAVGHAPPSNPAQGHNSGWWQVPQQQYTTYGGNPALFPAIYDPTQTYAQFSTVYLASSPTTFYILNTGDGRSITGGDPPGTALYWFAISDITILQISGASSVVSVALQNDPANPQNTAKLPTTGAIYVWQLGLYSNTTGWPSCGTYHEGRLGLAGAQKNRIDLSKSNQPFVFSPTCADGTVADDNGITARFNAAEDNSIFWMLSRAEGIVCGTLGGEWLVRAATTDEALSPVNIQARRVTNIGCFDQEPVTLPNALGFIQGLGRKIYEYKTFIDISAYVTRPDGNNLTETCYNLTLGGLEELAYQRQRLPVIWARTGNDNLIGISYKRDLGQEYWGGHPHVVGHGRAIKSLAVANNSDGSNETLWTTTKDPITGYYYVERLTDTFDETASDWQAQFADGRIVPSIGVVSGSNTIFSGLKYLEGKSVDFFACQRDIGTYVVSGGAITVPQAALSTATMTTFNGTNYGELGVPVNTTGSTYISIPAIVGFAYTSKAQMLRPIEGTQNGPNFAKTNRTFKDGLLLWKTYGISLGTDFSGTLYPASLKIADAYTDISVGTYYSGVVRDTLQADYGFNDQLCWQQTRPWPGTILVAGGFGMVADL